MTEAILNADNDHCFCAEVIGENADCPLHGLETDWALENIAPSEWRGMLLDAMDREERLLKRIRDLKAACADPYGNSPIRLGDHLQGKE